MAVPALPRPWSSAPDEQLARRPTDVLLLVGSLAALGLLSLAAPGPTEIDGSVTNLLKDLPGLAGWVWRACFALLSLWVVVLVLLAALTRERRRLVGHYALATAIALLLAGLASAAAGTSVSDGLRALVTPGPPPVYLGLRVAIFTAVVVTASPHLSRPLRYVGRTLMVLGALASIVLGVALPIGTTAGFLVGVTAAALTHLALGSPGGRPTRAEVATGLVELGIPAEQVADSPLTIAGSALFRADVPDGAIEVKAYGRDAWNGQLLTSTWATLTRRGETPELGAGRLACAEHEALVSLLAQRTGVPVLPVLAVGSTSEGDVLVVTRAPSGPALTEDVTDGALDEAWDALAALHAAGMVHGSISERTLVRDGSGRVALADFAQGSVADSARPTGLDDVRLLVASALVVGPQRAVAAAHRRRGDEGLVAMLPLIQAPALDGPMRRGIRRAEWRLKDLTAQACQVTGAQPPQLEPLARASWGSAIKVLLIGAFAYWLVGFVSSVDWSSVVAAFQGADLPWLAASLALSPLVQFWLSFGTLGATMARLQLRPVLMLQYAIQFIALVLPASAARVALEVRFFQTWGLATTAAVSVGVIDSVMGFVVQAVLIVTILLSGLAVVSPAADSTATSSGDGGPSGLAVVAGLTLLGIVLTVVVPSLRRRARAQLPRVRSAVRSQAAQARGALSVLRHPGKVALMLGGNVLGQVTQAVILGLCLTAFGGSADLAQLILVNTFVSLFAGLMPVPGGMGVAEAGLTVGLQAVGVPSAIAVSTAMAFRAVTFYLPPLWGSLAMRWLRRREYV
jgi:uncharacterized membrane protein YbhN (UPF0104 family)